MARLRMMRCFLFRYCGNPYEFGDGRLLGL
jgi:hypothetical protein